jgi:hypothetical protein
MRVEVAGAGVVVGRGADVVVHTGIGAGVVVGGGVGGAVNHARVVVGRGVGRGVGQGVVVVIHGCVVVGRGVGGRVPHCVVVQSPFGKNRGWPISICSILLSDTGPPMACGKNMRITTPLRSAAIVPGVVHSRGCVSGRRTSMK